MKETVFLPKTIRVGYQKRGDTYTGQLAYIIYLDHKDKVRKEVSWQSWRNSDITPNDFTNTPTSGFVLNKKVGGERYGWNPRQTYTRVYDPRGFEFEITVPNLLYILEHSNSIKGKGLEGDFVYGWDGTELLLIPVDAPDYKRMKEYSDSLFENNTFKKDDLILGATYKSKNNEHLVYLGHYPHYNGGIRRKKNPKKYFFQHLDDKRYEFYSGLKNKILTCLDETPVQDIADRVIALENQAEFCPLDPSKFKYTPIKDPNTLTRSTSVYILYEKNYYPMRTSWDGYGLDPGWGDYGYSDTNYDERRRIADLVNIEFGEAPNRIGYSRYGKVDINALHAKYPLHTITYYLENGKKLKK